MATPFFALQQISTVVRWNSPGTLRLNTFDASGNPINVSTGYTIEAFDAQAQSGTNPASSAVDLSSHVSSAFDATGVTLSWTAAQSEAICTALQTIANNIMVRLTNDSGTTNSILGSGTLSVDPLSNSL